MHTTTLFPSKYLKAGDLDAGRQTVAIREIAVEEIGQDRPSLSPEAKKDRILEALKRIILKGSEIRPLVMAFEDLHWADKT